MQKKWKFIWLYSIVLFSVALFLILISALAQVNIEAEQNDGQKEAEALQVFNQTAQQRVENLMRENELARLEIAENKIYISELEQKYVGLEESSLHHEIVTTARNFFSDAKYKECRDTLRTVDRQKLSEIAEEEYINLTKGLKSKGYDM